MSSFEQLTDGRFGVFLERLREEIAEGVRLYWSIASEVLQDSGVKLQELPSELLSIRRNFFSALFLYSYHRASIPKPRRVFYAAVNHCLRGMVTGCDNLLDDEYKPTLLTDLPEKGTRFRSVLDIMVSDRVLFHLLAGSMGRGELRADQAARACSASLRALARSGAQEAGEEEGIGEILEPLQILHSIHHLKTGLLFQSPWAIPRLVEPADENRWEPILDALHAIGIGCQIMDDMVDMASDVQKRRHNYLVSIIWHGENKGERSMLEQILEGPGLIAELEQKEGGLVRRFPMALGVASGSSVSYLRRGLASLLSDDMQPFVQPSIAILSELIGASRFMSSGGDSP